MNRSFPAAVNAQTATAIRQVEAEDFRSAAPGRLDDDAAAVGGVTAALDPAAGAYRTATDRNLPHGFTVSRADLAACMLATLGDPATVHRHVAIAS